MTKEPDYKPDPHWIGKDYYSTPEMAKAAHPALRVGDSVALLRTPAQGLRNIPSNHFIITKLNKVMTQPEAIELAEKWLLWTGYVMLEYSDGKGHWACLDAPAPRRKSFTLQQCDDDLDMLKIKNLELEAKLKLAMKLVAACTPIVMNTLAYTESGSKDFQQWFATAARDELASRKAITAILSDKQWKEIKTK